MYKYKAILALIPARGRSKGLPGKNIKTLLGKPLIAWTIEQARASKYIDKVLVSTDDERIAKISKRYEAEVPFTRPPQLARDSSATIDVILHALMFFEKQGQKYDFLILLEPTSPLRGVNDLDSAIKILIDNEEKADSLVSLGEVHLENPFITKLIVEGYVKPLIKEGLKEHLQRQRLPKAYFPYGVIYASKVAVLKDERTFYQKRTIPYVIERWQNYEIDDIWDFLCVEAILKERAREKNNERK